jgi:hypothetical protein
MARKPMIRVPVDDSADPKQRFDRLLTGLLAVKKEELQKIEEKLKAVRTEAGTRKREKPRRS